MTAMPAPHSFATVTPQAPKAPVPEMHRRFGKYDKGTVLPETQIQVSPRRRVRDFPDGVLNQKHIEHLEQNQKIASCCRHPENHEVEGRKSHADEPATDIYVFHCTCGRQHRFFHVGMGDARPEWK